MPKFITQLTTNVESPIASEIPAKTTTTPPNVVRAGVLPEESTNTLLTRFCRPVPMPVAIPVIPLVKMLMISVTTAPISLSPFHSEYIISRIRALYVILLTVSIETSLFLNFCAMYINGLIIMHIIPTIAPKVTLLKLLLKRFANL